VPVADNRLETGANRRIDGLAAGEDRDPRPALSAASATAPPRNPVPPTTSTFIAGIPTHVERLPMRMELLQEVNFRNGSSEKPIPPSLALVR
jgi:hypothetical protein